MATKLTDAKLRGLKAPETGQAEISDSDVPGLRARIGRSGAISFTLRKRVDGRVRNITIGRYGPRFGIAEARRKARQIISDIESGKGAPKPKPRSDILTIRALLPAYLDSKEGLRSSDEIARVMRRYVLPELGDRMADAVTRGEITKLIDDIALTAPSMARAVHAQLSAFYTWALPRLDRMVANPCRDAGRPVRSKARDRVMSDAELRVLWAAAEAEPMPWGPGVQLLIVTGARREEVFAADRAEFDTAAAVWTIPGARTKNGNPHIVPLSKLALQVLERIPDDDDSPKLFPTRTKSGKGERSVSGFSKAQARFRKALPDAEHWTFHDLRRTVATGLQRLGVRFEVTEAVLNHVSGARGGIAGVYQRHDWKVEKRDALDLWGDHVAKILKLSPE